MSRGQTARTTAERRLQRPQPAAAPVAASCRGSDINPPAA